MDYQHTSEFPSQVINVPKTIMLKLSNWKAL